MHKAILGAGLGLGLLIAAGLSGAMQHLQFDRALGARLGQDPRPELCCVQSSDLAREPASVEVQPPSAEEAARLALAAARLEREHAEAAARAELAWQATRGWRNQTLGVLP